MLLLVVVTSQGTSAVEEEPNRRGRPTTKRRQGRLLASPTIDLYQLLAVAQILPGLACGVSVLGFCGRPSRMVCVVLRTVVPAPWSLLYPESLSSFPPLKRLFTDPTSALPSAPRTAIYVWTHSTMSLPIMTSRSSFAPSTRSLSVSHRTTGSNFVSHPEANLSRSRAIQRQRCTPSQFFILLI